MKATDFPQTHTVAILGASDRPDRYAFLAVQMLLEKGHTALPIHPTLQEVLDIPVFPNLAALPDSTAIDTLTLYLGPARLEPLIPEILAARPKRVIFNPGTECPPLQAALDASGIPWIEACTLVLLRTGQF